MLGNLKTIVPPTIASAAYRILVQLKQLPTCYLTTLPRCPFNAPFRTVLWTSPTFLKCLASCILRKISVASMNRRGQSHYVRRDVPGIFSRTRLTAPSQPPQAIATLSVTYGIFQRTSSPYRASPTDRVAVYTSVQHP